MRLNHRRLHCLSQRSRPSSAVESGSRPVYHLPNVGEPWTRGQRVERGLKDSNGATNSIGPARQPFLQAVLIVFSGTLAVQAVAFVRQLVIASAFGVDRAMDIYVLSFTVATVVGFGLGAVIDSAAVPMLVQRLERGDRDGFRQIATRVLLIGIALGLTAALVFLAVVPIVANFVTVGLGPSEKAAMSALALWFAPWVAISAPFYAAGSLVKTEGRFRRFMIAEVLVTLVSLIILWFWRPGVHAIPVAYGAGYALAFITLLPGLPLTWPLKRHEDGRTKLVLGQITRFGAVAQVGTLGALADRFLASHLPAGAIAAGSYSALITGQTAALLGFREAYMVPLSESDRRAERLERMLSGLLMLSVPCAFFLSVHAQPVVSVLLERGRFDSAAVTLAAQMLAVQAIGIPVSVLILPLYRTLQILGRMQLAGFLLFASAVANLTLGAILMFGFNLGLRGYLLALLVGAHITFAIACLLVRHAGLKIDLGQPALFTAYASVSSAAGLLAGTAIEIDAPRFVLLAKDAVVFAVVYAIACLAILKPLRRLAGPFRALGGGGVPR